jgi:hypothetical protein
VTPTIDAEGLKGDHHPPVSASSFGFFVRLVRGSVRPRPGRACHLL